jgi:hypothetical protein
MDKEEELQPETSPAAGSAVISTDERQSGPPQPPPGVVVASNGAWRDEVTGRFVPGGKYDNKITEANTSEYHRMRQQKQLAGMLEADKRLYDMDPNYWGSLAVMRYTQALLGHDVAAVNAHKLVGQITGNLPSGSNGKDRSDPVPAGGARVELGADAVARLLEFIAESRE